MLSPATSSIEKRLASNQRKTRRKPGWHWHKTSNGHISWERLSIVRCHLNQAKHRAGSVNRARQPSYHNEGVALTSYGPKSSAGGTSEGTIISPTSWFSMACARWVCSFSLVWRPANLLARHCHGITCQGIQGSSSCIIQQGPPQNTEECDSGWLMIAK